MILNTIRFKLFAVLLLVLWIPVLSASGYAQNSSASSSADSLTAGEVFNLSIKLQLDQPYDKVIFPDSSAFPPVIDWLGTQQFRVTEFADSVLYRLQYFGNTDLTLPPFRIAMVLARDTTFIYTNPVQLYFKSILPSEDAELKPMKPIFSFDGFPWAWAIIILAILLAAAYAYYSYTRKGQVEEVKESRVFEPYKSPLAELESTLSYLKNDYDLAATKDYKYFYSALSDSIRAYYEHLYDIPALESTSRELYRYLDAFGTDLELIKQTRQILNSSDMVKFAKYTPTLEDAWKAHQDAVIFIDRARLIDASRISRKKSEYELQFKKQQEEEQAAEAESNKETA